MSEPSDPVETLAFAELLITCQVDGCQNIFEKTLAQPATDPVDEWAARMAGAARKNGWAVDSEGQVLCPVHAKADQQDKAMRELIERWHTFAAQSKEEIAAQFNDESRALFAGFFTKSFGDTGPQGAEWASAEQFAEYVLELRANEQAWSRNLGNTLHRMYELREAGQLEQAEQELRTFRDTCPWPFFADIAESQMQDSQD